MINLDEINSEIAKLESQGTTYATIERLSWLYTVRDHIAEQPKGKIPDGESDFRKCCSGKAICEVMDVMDELMETLLIIQPRLYDVVMDKFT